LQTTNQIRDRDWTTAFYDATELQRRQTSSVTFNHSDLPDIKYEGWNFNSGNYLFTTDTK